MNLSVLELKSEVLVQVLALLLAVWLCMGYFPPLNVFI